MAPAGDVPACPETRHMSDIYTGRYHDGERWVVGLFRRGTKNLHITFRDDSGLRHIEVPMAEERYVKPVTYKGNPYPVSRMVRKMRGLPCSMTESAKDELRRAS